MERVRDSLRDIVRTRDSLSAPVGSALLIVFRDLDVESATDICRALLSHLHRVCADSGAGLRIAVGLAHMTRERAALHTLLAANNALLQARSSGAAEQLRVERTEDYPLLISAAIHAAGVFGAEHTLRGVPDRELSRSVPRAAEVPPVQPIERGIEGYVVDNMEGAVDQAMFLARLDVPVAIVGPAGTGKMYVAKIVHEQWGGAERLVGRVRRVEPYGFTKVSALGIEEQRVNVLIDLVDPAEQWLRLGHGYRVEVRIVLWQADDVVKAPLSALFREGDGWAVFAQEDGRARLRPVSRGRHDGLEAEIREGLAPGDVIVRYPSERVGDGTRIAPRG